MQLEVTVNKVTVTIDLPDVNNSNYDQAVSILDNCLKNGRKKREAIAASFLYLLKSCPNANPSDLWHHIVYRSYLNMLPNYYPQDPGQSWKRAAGDALELVIENWYAPTLKPHNIWIEVLLNKRKREKALKGMNISDEVGSAKLDIGLYADINNDKHVIIGGVHVKGSLAERVSDDIPASRAMMDNSYFSALWTLDVKSFPPPQGDLVNRGELGTPERPSDKRKYIENHGDFDNCYSANNRTEPSSGTTSSGKKVHRLSMSQQPDQFAMDIITYVNSLRKQP